MQSIALLKTSLIFNLPKRFDCCTKRLLKMRVNTGLLHCHMAANSAAVLIFRENQLLFSAIVCNRCFIDSEPGFIV